MWVESICAWCAVVRVRVAWVWSVCVYVEEIYPLAGPDTWGSFHKRFLAGADTALRQNLMAGQLPIS